MDRGVSPGEVLPVVGQEQLSGLVVADHLAFIGRKAVEQIAELHAEHLADPPQHRRADAVRAGFVFLDLLKADAQSLTKRRL